MSQSQSPTSRAPEVVAERQNNDDDDDDSLMVHTTEVDYAGHARKHREELLAEGKEVVLMSELSTLIPCREGESAGDYVNRYADGMNDMIRRGVYILSDQITHDVAPGGFHIDGHDFDVGPESGVTKKEYREFSELLGRGDLSYDDIPQRFKKFEVEKPHSEV